MPRRIEPKTLQEISLKSSASLTNKLCIDIERNYGGWKCPASRDKLAIVKRYLSTIQPLFDKLSKAVLDMCFRDALLKTHIMPSPPVVKDKCIILEVLLCDKLRTLNTRGTFGLYECCSDSVFWKHQLLKLSNVVDLNIKKVRLTDESFQAIGDVCTNLIKICVTSDLEYASKESLAHILKCTKLEDVRIRFRKWDRKSRCEYTRRILTGLPKLENFRHFEHWLQWNKEGGISISTPLTSMRVITIHLRQLNFEQVGAIIRLCPNLKDVSLIGGNEEDDFGARESVLKTIGNSSLQLDRLSVIFPFYPEITNLITSNCSNLTSLDVGDWERRRISVNDIYTIGVSCPKIEKLRVERPNYDIEMQPQTRNIEEQTFLTAPPMFVHLKVLFLWPVLDWDQRILPFILRHANNLTDITLKDTFKPQSTSLHALTELLNLNALRELESLHYRDWYRSDAYRLHLPVDSVERLVDSCPKLCKLVLRCPMESDTIRYLRSLERNIKTGNFDFALEFEYNRYAADYYASDSSS